MEDSDTSSICSLQSRNESVSDLPGPGRLIDKYVYQRGGRALENAIARLRRKPQASSEPGRGGDIELNAIHSNPADTITSHPLATNETGTNNGASDGQNTELHRPISLYYECSLFSSSTLTASDNIGPGRTLYKLYALGGKALESLASNIAHKAGYGPHVTGKRIIETYEALREEWFRAFVQNDSTSVLMIKLEETVFQQCKILAEYTCAESAQTRQQSLEWIITLATQYRRLRHHLKHPQIMESLQRLPDLYLTRRYADDDTLSFLQFLSDQAVVCVMDSELTEIVDEIVLSFSADIVVVLNSATEGLEASDDVKVIDISTVFRLFDYCFHPIYSYAALRFSCLVLAMLTDNRLEKPLSRHKRLIWTKLSSLVDLLLDSIVPERDVNFDSEDMADQRDPDGVDLLCETVLHTLLKEFGRLPPSKQTGFWSNLTANLFDKFKGNPRIELHLPRANAVAQFGWETRPQNDKGQHVQPPTINTTHSGEGDFSPASAATAFNQVSLPSVARVSQSHDITEAQAHSLSFLSWKRRARHMYEIYYSLIEKAGYGPSDPAELVNSYFEYARTDIVDSGQMFGMLLALGWSCNCENLKKMSEVAIVIKLDEQITNLLGYLRKKDAQTQLLTLRHLADLCTMYPVLRQKLNTQDIRERLSRLPITATGLHFSKNECQQITEAARKAIICIEDNQVTQLVASLSSLISKQVVDLQHRHDYIWGGTQGVYYREENFIVAELLRLCLDTDLGYVALRYTTSVVFWLLSYQSNKLLWGSVYKTMRAFLTSASISQDSSAVDAFAATAIKKLYFVCSCSEPGSAERNYWAKQVSSFTSLFRSVTAESIFTVTITMIPRCNEIYPDLLSDTELDTIIEDYAEPGGHELSSTEAPRSPELQDGPSRARADVANLGFVLEVAFAPPLHEMYKAIGVALPEEM